MNARRLQAAVLSVTLAGCRVDCAGNDVHGQRGKALDGGAAIVAGPFDWACAAKVDGAPVAQGVPVAVKPGRHRVSCDAELLEVSVRAGEVVTIDYFGP